MSAATRLLLAAARGGGGIHLPAIEETLVLVAAGEGGWAEPQTPKAIEYGGHLYVGSVSGADGDALVAILPPGGPGVVRVMHAALGGEAATDMHDNCSLLVRESDHKLMAFYCRHADTGVRLRISNTSLDTDPMCADGFTSEVVIDVNTSVIDYPMVHQLTGETDDPIYLLFRSTSGSTARWLVCKSTDDGATWSNNEWWYRNDGFTAYMQSTSNGVDRIDFVAQNKNEDEASPNTLHHGYYEGGSFFDSGGASLGTYPLASPLTPGVLTEISSGIAHHLYALQRDDATGHIACMAAEVGGGLTARRCYWDGASWTTSTVASADVVIWGACIDPANLDRVWVSRNLGGVAGLWEYAWTGSWAGEQIGSGTADWLWPQPVRNGSTYKIVVMYGEYHGYLNWLADIYALAG